MAWLLRSNWTVGGELPDINMFDLVEWKHYWQRNPDHDFDILDLGYWLKDGSYEPPVLDWRQEAKRSV